MRAVSSDPVEEHRHTIECFHEGIGLHMLRQEMLLGYTEYDSCPNLKGEF